VSRCQGHGHGPEVKHSKAGLGRSARQSKTGLGATKAPNEHDQSPKVHGGDHVAALPIPQKKET